MPDSVSTTAIHHVSFLTADTEKTAAFYCNVLGFHHIRRPDMQFPGAWLFRNGLQIHLIGGQGHQAKDGEISSRADHIAFHAEDTDAVEKLLQEHDVKYRVNIQTGSGVKQIFFHDPDGHTLEIAVYPTPVPVGEE
ncbi:MAG: VOC family protein [Planctomycetales bacterium]